VPPLPSTRRLAVAGPARGPGVTAIPSARVCGERAPRRASSKGSGMGLPPGPRLGKRSISPTGVTRSLPRWRSWTALLPSTAAIWGDRASLEKRGLFDGRYLDALAAAWSINEQVTNKACADTPRRTSLSTCTRHLRGLSGGCSRLVRSRRPSSLLLARFVPRGQVSHVGSSRSGGISSSRRSSP
jgi:hypothetical protein